MQLTNKAVARMCGFLAYQTEGRWVWYAADRGGERCTEFFTNEDDAYRDCVIKAGLVKVDDI